ncbi:hypothetical protein [Vibrio rotiferianus]|uniref:hypothetical protein n=1 Tax=Vibrio rotiferianus TaxID=190895 RepID=UPI000399CB68|nr:hypothetical protein [Vibrio rotiferianus]PIB15125.1 hypothetical protein B853_15385 [Vibrio rotiferianus CAIM 577 = LMG 21460]
MKVSKTVKIDITILKKLKNICSYLKQTEHSYLIDAIEQKVSNDFATYRKYLEPEQYRPESTCPKSGVYKVIFYDYANDMITSSLGDYWQAKELSENSSAKHGISSKNNEVKENSLLATFLTEQVGGKKHIKEFIFVEKGKNFPPLDSKYANCYELLSEVTEDFNYELDSQLLNRN